MPVQARAIKALLDAHKIAKASVVGNSVGGWVAATFAATYPSAVDKLILIDAAGFKAMFEGPPPVNFDPANAEEMQKLIDITLSSPVAHTPGLAQRAYDAYVASGEKAISATWGKSLFVSPRLEDLLPKISAKTLVLWGADDKLFHPSWRASLAAWSKDRVRISSRAPGISRRSTILRRQRRQSLISWRARQQRWTPCSPSRRTCRRTTCAAACCPASRDCGVAEGNVSRE